MDKFEYYFPHMLLSNLVSKVDFELEVVMVSKVMVYSNYFGYIVNFPLFYVVTITLDQLLSSIRNIQAQLNIPMINSNCR